MHIIDINIQRLIFNPLLASRGVIFVKSTTNRYMKKIVQLFLLFFFVSQFTKAQGIKGFLDKVTKKDSSGKTVFENVANNFPRSTTSLSNEDIINGLKEALRVGTDSSSIKLGSLNGYFANAAIKILMPEEAKKMERTLRNFGMGKLVDNAILSMNRAAEDAAQGIGNIFWNAITQMSIQDGLQILRGGDFAATEYLKKTTTLQLTEKFRPVIETSLAKTGATKYWSDVFSTYNKFSRDPVNTDLVAFVTERSLQGLFYQISLEEQKIRKDPAAQVTAILKKVFGKG